MSFLSELRSQRARASRLLVFICGTTTLLLGWPTPASAGFIGGDGRLAFQHYFIDGGPGEADTEIMTVGKNGDGRIQLTDNGVADFDPAWSPDGGSSIAFVRNNESSLGDVWLMDELGGGKTKVIGGRKDQFAPSWSPTGTHLLYVQRANEDAPGRLWIARVDGTQRERFHLGRRSIAFATWSPTGRKIAFVGGIRRRGSSVFTMRFDGTRIEKVAEASDESSPQWSPDGRELLVASPGLEEIHRMDADGSNRRKFALDPGGAEVASPVWSPSGREIAYLYEGDTGGCGSLGYISITSSFGIDERRLVTVCSGEEDMGNLDWQPRCTVVGTDRPNDLTYHPNNVAAELACGGGGPDDVSGGARGVAFGEEGNDTVYGRIANGGPGRPLVEGLPLILDDDTIHGVAGRAFLADLTGNDIFFGGPQDDVLLGSDGEGGDELRGGRGTDVCVDESDDERTGCEKNRRDLIRR
ncbi:MAG: hypothetical protein M3285_06550 [Actinomycetota bacterium]|nr:hypothetical protein [Actinomycetota bacterium]